MYHNTYRIRERSYHEMLLALADSCHPLGADKISVNVSASGIERRFALQSTSASHAADLLRAEAQKFGDFPWIRCFQFDVHFESLGTRGVLPAIAYLPEGEKPPLLRTTNFKAIDAAATILAAFHKNLDFIPFDLGSASILPTAEAEVLRRQQDSTSALVSEVDRLGRFTTQQIERNARHFDDITAKADAYLQAQRERLDSEFSRKQVELDSRTTAFAAEKKEFDSRENRHVRRALLTDIRQQIQQNTSIKLSDSTTQKRKAVRNASFFAMAVGLALMGTMLTLAAISGQTEWFEVAGASSGALLFGSTLVFYLRWTNSWSSQHAEFEWRNRKFADDVLRASWLAELLFEWHDQKGKPDFPAELVRSFSRDLFVLDNARASTHPSEDLAHMLKSLRRIRLGKDLLEVERASPAAARRK